MADPPRGNRARRTVEPKGSYQSIRARGVIFKTRIQGCGSTPQDDAKLSSCGPAVTIPTACATALPWLCGCVNESIPENAAGSTQFQGAEICGARGCNGVPPPPTELGPLLLTTWSTVRIVSMS